MSTNTYEVKWYQIFLLPLSFIVFSCLSIQAFAQSISLTIQVKNVIPKRGVVHIAIYEGDQNWLDEKKVLKLISMEASHETLSTSLYNLKPGEYGVAVFQDENRNKICDANFIGIPKEKIGFSNNVIPRFSKPSFQKCKMVLRQKENITINLFNY